MSKIFDFQVRYNKDLTKFQHVARDHMIKATYEATNFPHSEIPAYPPASGKPYPFKSAKQALFVKASIAEGKMEVPYRRTAQLGRSITKEVRAAGAGDFHLTYVGVIGTKMVYAPWVISRDKVDGIQGNRGPPSQYHSGLWYTLQDLLDRNMKKIYDIYKKAVDGMIVDFFK